MSPNHCIHYYLRMVRLTRFITDEPSGTSESIRAAARFHLCLLGANMSATERKASCLIVSTLTYTLSLSTQPASASTLDTTDPHQPHARGAASVALLGRHVVLDPLL